LELGSVCNNIINAFGFKSYQKKLILLTKWCFVVNCGNNIYIFELYNKDQPFWKSIFQAFLIAKLMLKEG